MRYTNERALVNATRDAFDVPRRALVIVHGDGDGLVDSHNGHHTLLAIVSHRHSQPASKPAVAMADATLDVRRNPQLLFVGMFACALEWGSTHLRRVRRAIPMMHQVSEPRTHERAQARNTRTDDGYRRLNWTPQHCSAVYQGVRIAGRMCQWIAYM